MADFLNNLSDSEILQKAKLIKENIGEVSASGALSSAILDALNSDTDTLTEDLREHHAAQATARGKRQKKDASVKKIKKTLRDVRRKLIAADAAEKDILLLAMNSTKTLPSNATVPFVRIDTGARFQHTFFITDEASPELKRKPRGAIGCEIFAKIGGSMPLDDTECRYLMFSSKSKCKVEFDGEDVGKMAHYMLRWRMRDGSVSPWSDTVSATITG